MRSMIAAGLLLTGAAWADANDLRIYQLGNPDVGKAGYSASANANFRVFARELAAALTSINLMPPSTLGHSGFALNAELSTVSLRTSRFVLPTEQYLASGANPEGALLIPSLHVRKGLPFSFEVGSRLAWIEKSHMAAATLDVKWAITESFAYLPDVGVRASVMRLLNSRDLELTTGGLDLGVGKRFALGGMVTLTPYVGWNLVWVSASSNNVDFAPGATNQESVRTPLAQLQNAAVFRDVDFAGNSHNRFYGGLRFIGGVMQFGAEISYANLGKFHDSATDTDVSPPAVVAINGTLGFDF